MLWAASCMGFFAFVRSGEFTSTQTQQSPIRPKDILVDNKEFPNYIRIFLGSKTDPFGKGVALYVDRTHQRICPVAAILAFLAIRLGSKGSLFINRNAVPLTKSVLVRNIWEALTRGGLNATGYSRHSFRIGAATTAAAVGISDVTIKVLGQWESSAYLRYIRTPRLELVHISSTLLGKGRSDVCCGEPINNVRRDHHPTTGL